MPAVGELTGSGMASSADELDCNLLVAGLGSYGIGCPDARTPLPVPHG